MRRPLLAASAGLVFLVAACGSAPAASTAPGATIGPVPSVAIPSIAIPSIAIPTLPPAGGGGTAVDCGPFPTFSLSNPVPPSFSPDTTLESHFPTQVDGQPVTDVTSGSWLEFICLYAGQQVVNQDTALLPAGFNVANLSFGSAKATVDGDDVSIQGFRYAGGDANAIIQYFAQIAFALSGGRETLKPFTMSTATIGGKNIDVATSADGVTYVYPAGDTLITLDNVTDSQANKIFSAIP